jgi:hypothetical protein
MRISLAPIACSLVSFVAGYVAFHPAWRKVAPLSDGSVASFQQASEAVANGNLLEKASPQERVGWLLEICRQPDGAARDFALYEAIQKMQPSDFIAAFTQLEELGAKMYAMSQETREALATVGMERWMDVDPAGAKRVLSATVAVIESGAVKLPKLESEELLSMDQVLARRDPEWTKQMISRLDSKTGRGVAILSLITEEMLRNPKQAREWSASYQGTPDERMATLGCLYGLVKTDPQTALATALAEKDDKKRPDCVDQTFELLARDNPAAIPGLLPQLDAETRRKVMRRTLTEVLADPSLEPFDYLQQNIAGAPEGDAAGMILGSMETLIGRDPAKTMELVNSLPASQRPRTMDAALQRWSNSDPAGLLDWLKTQPADQLPAGYAIGGLAAADPEKFDDWSKSLPAGAFRDGARLDLVGAQVSQGNTAAAMADFPQDFTSQSQRGGAYYLASELAKKDLQGSANWVSAMSSGLGQQLAASAVAGVWTKKSPDDAANWLQSLPAGNLRDGATAGFADIVASKDPAAAGEWIEQIADTDARSRAASKLMSSWKGSDSAQARAWLENLTGVPDSLKNYWLHHSQ